MSPWGNLYDIALSNQIFFIKLKQNKNLLERLM